MLLVHQSDAIGPFYYEVFSGARSIVNAAPGAPITLYMEPLDLSRFKGPAYEKSLQQHLLTKYRDKPIGVVVAIGSAALQYVLRVRASLWPGIPVVFGMVDKPTIDRLHPPPDVTGVVMHLRFADMVTTARAVVPDLQGVVLVGDAWDTQTAYRHWQEEIPGATAGLAVTDLTGLTMRELQQRVAALPPRTAILYSAIYSNGEGTFFPPADALSLLAKTANRPIVVSAETFVGRGAIGGFVMSPTLIGGTAARLAVRTINGESVANASDATSEIVRPVFDWRQMRRWGVNAASLPPGSNIRFREPTVWERYPWQIATIVAALLLQSVLILRLVHEHRRRRSAEIDARSRMSELAHMNRHATAGEMSSSLAHELNQPLGAILSNTQAAERMLKFPSPNLDEIAEILADIRRDDLRASEVIRRLRSLLTRTAFEMQDVDLNDTLREVFDFLLVQASARHVELSKDLPSRALYVRGDRIQLQQVVLNLVVNGMDAMADVPGNRRRITGTVTQRDDRTAVVTIADSGSGIPPDGLARIFEPFFTTKAQGMGMGLAIVRTIVEAHGGRIWAENRAGGGAMVSFSLPLAPAQ